MSSKKSKAPAKKGLVGWIFYFAGNKKGQYIVSVFFALLSVACRYDFIMSLEKGFDTIVGGIYARFIDSRKEAVSWKL